MIRILIPALLLSLGACGSLVDAEFSSCDGSASKAQAAECVATAAGIPALPPPPCWNEAGEIQPDEICASLDDEAGADESRTSGETLPAPPPLPD